MLWWDWKRPLVKLGYPLKNVVSHTDPATFARLVAKFQNENYMFFLQTRDKKHGIIIIDVRHFPHLCTPLPQNAFEL